MATITQIKALRVKVNDPAGAIRIADVADNTHFPSTPHKNYAYYDLTGLRYYMTDKESGAVTADYKECALRLDDDSISDLIDDVGEDAAVYRAIRLIMAKLGDEMRLESMSSGTESSTYTALRDLYNFYKGLSTEYKDQELENSGSVAGRYGRTREPTIAGGNL